MGSAGLSFLCRLRSRSSVDNTAGLHDAARTVGRSRDPHAAPRPRHRGQRQTPACPPRTAWGGHACSVARGPALSPGCLLPGADQKFGLAEPPKNLDCRTPHKETKTGLSGRVCTARPLSTDTRQSSSGKKHPSHGLSPETWGPGGRGLKSGTTIVHSPGPGHRGQGAVEPQILQAERNQENGLWRLFWFVLF